MDELHAQIAREARRVAEAELFARAAAVDEGAAPPLALLGELGLLAPDVPDDCGGAGADPLARVLVLEALAGSCASTAFAAGVQGLAARAALAAGDRERARGLATGAVVAALAVDERSVLGPRGATVALSGSRLVPAEEPGQEEAPPLVGLRGLVVRTRRDPLPGPPPQAGEGGLVAAVSAGLVARGLEEARRYAMMRQQFGRPIARFQGVQFLVAQVLEGREGCRALARGAALAEMRGEPSAALDAACLLEAPARAVKALLDVVQVFGGTGYTREVVAERLLRDGLALQSLAGAAGAGGERTLARDRLGVFSRA